MDVHDAETAANVDRLVNEYLASLEAADADRVIALFTSDGTVESPLYGTMPAAEFSASQNELTPVAEVIDGRRFPVVTVRSTLHVALKPPPSVTFASSTNLAPSLITCELVSATEICPVILSIDK